MLAENVEKHLQEYRRNKGRFEFLGVEIRRLKAELALAKTKIVEDEASIGAQVISDMPRGTTVGNPTERLGMKLADGYIPPFITCMEQDIDKYTKERESLEIKVLFVEAWLTGLSERERWIITECYLDGECYQKIQTMYQKEFNDDPPSVQTLKRMKKSTFLKICKMAE